MLSLFDRVKFKRPDKKRFSIGSFLLSLKPFPLLVTGFLLASTLTLQARPKYSAIVMDMKAGRVIHSDRADSPRYPASLTKIMTLYMLFEAIEDGRFTMNSQLVVSKYAASKSPSKLWLRPGQTIKVKDAIRALVTKSANDVAATVAENVAGTEARFARLMTQKARHIGMKNTTYKNASGLPNRYQKTTARDQLTLGRRIQQDFPQYYHFFSTRKFTYGKRRYGNHNRLLYRYRGTDGIKTGYTRASGFNLVSSVRRGNKHLIAVVMGGRTAGRRNRRMAYLLNRGFRRAKSRRHDIMTAGLKRYKRNRRSKTVKIAKLPLPTLKPAIVDRDESKTPIKLAQLTAKKSDPMHELITEALKAPIIEDDHDTAPEIEPDKRLPALDRVSLLGAVKANLPNRDARKIKGPYHIQIGAYKGKANSENWLDHAVEEASDLLEGHEGFTMPVPKEANLYRARFDGFTLKKAENTCSALKEKSIPCIPVKAL